MAKSETAKLRKSFNRILKTARRALIIHDTESVHTVRVQIKQARAALALYRPVLEASWCQQADARLRAISHQLSGDRDAQVMRALLAHLCIGIPDVQQRLMSALPEASGLPNPQLIPKLQKQFTKLKMPKDACSPVVGECVRKRLRRQYRKVRRLWKQYRSVPADWHLCRRQLKKLQYQLLRYQPQCVNDVFWQELRQTGQLLGDWHDLQVLQEFCAAHRRLFWADDLQLLNRAVARRYAALTPKIQRYGKSAFASKELPERLCCG